MFTFIFMKSKLRADNSGFVRISNKAIKLAKSNKRKTGIPIGKFIEQAIFAYEMISAVKKDEDIKVEI